jgi:flagellar FliL protein
MFSNKLFNMSLIILIGITLLGGIAFVLWKTTFVTASPNDEIVNEKRLTADEMVAQSVSTEIITTNLYSEDYIVIQFSILLDSSKSKEEFEKRMIEARAIIISVLSSLTPEDLKGEEGINRLEAILITRFNDILQEGKVVRVLTIDRKIQ